MLGTSQNERLLLIAGCILILIGLGCNEWAIRALLSNDGVLAVSNRMRIWVLEAALISSGTILIVLRRRMDVKGSIRRIASAIRSHPKIGALLFGTCLSVVILTLIETTFFVINARQSAMAQVVQTIAILRDGREENIDERLLDSLLGFKARPNIQIHVKRERQNRVIVDVTISIDEYSRRHTPVAHLSGRDQFALFFGGSYMFGAYLSDNQTLPFYFSEYARDYMPYNYALGGYGTQQMLAKLEGAEIAEEIHQKQGIGIYLFIDHHIHRSIGSMWTVTAWGYPMPFYDIQNGKLVRKKDYPSGRPVISFIYRLIGRSPTLHYFNIELPPIAEKHIRLTSRIICESYLRFKTTFPRSPLYVVFYPGTRYAKRIAPYLENCGIRYLDYSNLFDPQDTRFSIPGEGHPSANAYKTLAHQLAKDLGMLSE